MLYILIDRYQYFKVVKDEVEGSSKTFMSIYKTIQCHIPETVIFLFTTVRNSVLRHIMCLWQWYVSEGGQCDLIFEDMRCSLSVMTSVNLFTYCGMDGINSIGWGHTLDPISDSVLRWLWTKNFNNLLWYISFLQRSPMRLYMLLLDLLL